jgi:diguanylate cyclase (GGDEF)-like protein
MFRRLRTTLQKPEAEQAGTGHGSTSEATRAIRLLAAYEAEGSGWFWETDDEGRLTYLSAHILDALSAAGPSPLGAPLVSVFELEPDNNASSRTLQFHLSVKSTFRSIAVRGSDRAVTGTWCISGKPQVDAEGRFQGFVGSGIDLTEKRRSQSAITRLAYTDGLTGLANRERMRTTLEHLLGTRQSGFDPTALLMLDLDRFKAINDTLGHLTGDQLLKQVAQRLERIIEKTGVVGRLGGDEFQVILASESARNDAEAIAKTIIETLSRPYSIKGTPITIGCSVGIAVAPEQGQSVETLTRNADLALYAAKDGGRSTHRVFSEDLLTDAKNRRQLEDDLRLATSNGELYLVYQQVVSTATEQIVGYEALLRWNHPRRGSVSPAEFIPIAEETGLIAGIGEWVLRTAVADCATWPGDIRVAVNVSPLQFANPKLPDLIANTLTASGLAPDRLELEVTEGVFLRADGDSDRTFKSLKNLGVRLALDDFGTGYSSLGYLQKAPFDKIKIDQSFVRGAIMAGSRNAAIIKAIVTLASTLGLETTAEGVEQQDEVVFVRELGCSSIQGFVYGKPARAEQVSADLGKRGLAAQIVGHRISRAPREKVILKAHLVRGGDRSEATVRNTSDRGAMVESASISSYEVGAPIAIELQQGPVRTGTIRWIDGQRAGVEMSRPRV